MKLIIGYTWVVVAFLTTVNTQAQSILSLSKAIEISLQNNYSILVARNSAEMTSINNSPGNAGMLPELALKGSGSYSVSNENMVYSSGSESTISGLVSRGINAGVELNWTLFDGGRMFLEASKLERLEKIGELQYQQEVLATVYDVVSAYYNIVRQKQQLKTLTEIYNLNSERMKIADAAYKAGNIAKNDLLQTKIDLNITLENILNQNNVIYQSYNSLRYLLSWSADSMFEVEDSIPFSYTPNVPQLLVQLDSANVHVEMYRKQVQIAELNLKQSKQAYLPVLGLRAGYYTGMLRNSNGNLLENNNYGPEVLASVSIPLYSAGENRRKVANSKLQLSSANMELESVKLLQRSVLYNALAEYDNFQKLLVIEEENFNLSREAFELSIERLRLGQTTSIEVHAAQEAYVQSSTRLLNYRFGLKMAEIKLKQLVGQY